MLFSLGSIIPIPQPPQNFVGATSLQDSNALLENPAGVLSGVEQSQVVTKVSKQLLAQLQSANLIVQGIKNCSIKFFYYTRRNV